MNTPERPAANGEATQVASDEPALAAAVRRRRLRAGLSQQELADRAQMSIRAIANIEAGRVRRPHPYSLRRIAEALQISDCDLDGLIRQSRASSAVNGPTKLAGGDGRPTPLDGDRVPFGVPRQLPSSVGDFTGRQTEARSVAHELVSGQAAVPPVAVISGPAGIGKTALALKVAHRLVPAFPDGVLFADLGGLERPEPAATVMSRFLRALGVEGMAVPEDIQERAALLRSCTAARRLLIVLDNAVDEPHVRPLLPGSGTSATIITSRGRLDALESAKTFDLALLTPQESFTLLEQMIDPGRLSAERGAMEEIVRHCGGLPLAVRIAGARLASRRDASIASFAGILADERQRLDRLRVGDLEVRASIRLGYEALTSHDRQVFQRLTLIEVPDFSAWAIAPLADDDLAAATTVAERLAERRLIEIIGTDPSGEPRYRLHDLIRLFAREQEGRFLSQPAEHDALRRALGRWLSVAHAITEGLPSVPDDVTPGSATRWQTPDRLIAEIRSSSRSWFRAERLNLSACVQAAAANGLHQYAWEIAGATTSPCILYSEYELAEQMLNVAQRSCGAVGDAKGEAAMMALLGRLRMEVCRYDEARQLLLAAYERFDALHDLHGKTFTATFVADTLRMLREQTGDAGTDEAWRWGRICATLTERLGDEHRRADSAYVMGKLLLSVGRTGRAASAFEEFLSLSRRLGKPVAQAHALYRIGTVSETAGRYADAVAAYQQALAINRSVGDRLGVAYVILALARAFAEMGRKEEAVAHGTEAKSILADLHIDPLVIPDACGAS